MTTGAAPGTATGWARSFDAASVEAWRAPDARRLLQLTLAALWLLDALLQLQPFMFSRSFGSAMLAGGAVGNPVAIGHPITWAAREVAANAAASNAVFCLVQLLIGLGIAWRPAVKAALSVSVAWSLGVWWLGEGLGGVLTGHSSPVSGAPGAALLYAVAAVLLWPTDRSAGAISPRCVAERPFGPAAARLAWLALWTSLCCFTLLPYNRAADGLSRMISQTARTDPAWLKSLDLRLASALAGHGGAASVVLGVLLGLVAICVFLPAGLARAALAIAAGIAVATWAVGQGLGGVFGPTATDPGTGPVLLLLCAHLLAAAHSSQE